MLLLTLLAACGSNFRFVVTSPDVPLDEDDTVLYRIDEGDDGSSAGGLFPMRCDDGECRSTGNASDEIAEGAEILVWLDVEADDWDEWEAEAELGERDIADLHPDPVDPRDALRWERGLGVHVIEAELRLP